MGNDNKGDLTFRYGLEDTDYIDGVEVFRVSNSTFFCRLRDLFGAELKELYNTLESNNAWKSESLINQFDEWQAQFPEELWRLDIERKYIRTYNSSFINGSGNPDFLTGMCFGRKKYQRRQYERNQEKYMASKYQSTLASTDTVFMRCEVPVTDLVVEPNFTFTLIPFAYMYLNVQYGTGNKPLTVRAEPGVPYTLEYSGTSADIINVYSASNLQSLGNLSSFYLNTLDTSKAVKLKELIIGSDIAGYNNPSLTTLTMGANELLEVLNIENVSGLTSSLSMYDEKAGINLYNLRELYANGTNIAGVTFAPSGMIEVAELPGTLNAISMKNLAYLSTFDVASYANLTTLTVENCATVDLLALLSNAPNLTRVRLLGVDWELESTELLQTLLTLKGIDGSGYNTDQSVLTGAVHVPVMREKELADYNAAWPDLALTYNTLVEQFTVTYVNDDGTVLDIQYVDKGSVAVDPLTREDSPIDVPTKESTVSTDYTFAGWDSEPVASFENQVITATYTGTTRIYTVQYTSMGAVKQETQAEYGTSVIYTGDVPTYTSEESAYKYYLFDDWDKSGYVDGDKVITAVFDSCEYSAGYFDGKEISELRPVEIYAMMQLGLESTYVESKDVISIALGNDVSYDDIEEEILIAEPTIFNGTNYVDTGVQLFSEDRSFVMAIDYSLASDNSTGNVLAQCYSGSGMSGFRLLYNNGVKLNWGAASTSPSDIARREIVILRHVKGETGLHVYASNSNGDASTYVELSGSHSVIHDNTIVFGCSRADDGVYENHANGIVYWSKVWYTDLGDDLCAHLAYWPHETLNFEMCGFRRYYRTDIPSKMCSMSFLASTPLSSAMKISGTTYNSGGWAECTLNPYLNDRIYNAFPLKWKQLMKPVKIYSSIGDQSTEISSSSCYIAIPAVVELGGSSAEPYGLEGSAIDFMSSNTARILYDNDGNPVSYWTRSPSAESNIYQWYVGIGGALSKYSTINTEHHIRIIISL